MELLRIHSEYSERPRIEARTSPLRFIAQNSAVIGSGT